MFDTVLNPSKYLPAQNKNRNSRKRCEICSKLTTKTPKQRQRKPWTYFIHFSIVSIVEFDQVDVCGDVFVPKLMHGNEIHDSPSKLTVLQQAANKIWMK